MNTIREIEKINLQELELGIAGTSASWHTQFANSAWCYLGNVDHQLTEGDILCIMSQFGEVEDIHLVRDEETGKSRGFAFLKYEDSRSCILAVDNLCGVLVLGRSLRVDHVEQYRLPKKLQEQEEASKTAEINDGSAGHAYKDMELENNYNIHEGMDLFAPPPPSSKNENNNNKSNIKNGKINDEEHKKQEEKLKRKEDRQRQREEKEQRKRRREEKREKSDEKKRQKRSHKHRRRTSSDDDSHGDHDYNDNEKVNKRSDRKKSKVTIDDADDNDTERRKERKRHHRSSHSSSRQERTKRRSKSDKD
ncbi:MAG: RNA-binding motif X-linked protein 2 [Bacillariaceae sp.]|jgi:RNA-binding motif X-linked protein 2